MTLVFFFVIKTLYRIGAIVKAQRSMDTIIMKPNEITCEIYVRKRGFSNLNRETNCIAARVTAIAAISDATLILATNQPEPFLKQCKRSINIVNNRLIFTSKHIQANNAKIGNVVSLNKGKMTRRGKVKFLEILKFIHIVL